MIENDQFKQEELNIDWLGDGYSIYNKPRPINHQLRVLNDVFPEIGFTNERFLGQKVPLGAEGLFALPMWQSVAQTYSQAVLKVLSAIALQRQGYIHTFFKDKIFNSISKRFSIFRSLADSKFFSKYEVYNLFEAINEDRLKPLLIKELALQEIKNQQQGNKILIVPAQLGLRHRGRSARRANEVMVSNKEISEFPLGAFEVGIMILTHPETMMGGHFELQTICSGDHYDTQGLTWTFSVLGDAPVFRPFGEKNRPSLHFCRMEIEKYSWSSGAASGFVSK